MVNSIPYQLNKRTTIFEDCPSKFIFPGSVFVTVISNATLTPDPVKSNETVTVTGSATIQVNKTGDEVFTFLFYDSNLNYIEGGGGEVKLCNPDCPANYYPINLTTNAPPNLPSNYSIVLAIRGNKVPH
ncbi:44919_t:CDS:1, partial [Gigaspora margarita]